MAEYEVGYGRPPKKSRFKPGVSGNPKGRPKRMPAALAEIIRQVLDVPVRHRAQGRITTATRYELLLKAVVENSVKGKLDAAEQVLKFRAHATRFGDIGVERLQINSWLPDYPGQTAEEKTREFANAVEINPLQWWCRSNRTPGE